MLLGRLRLRHGRLLLARGLSGGASMTRHVDHAAINKIDLEHSHVVKGALDRKTMTKIVATVGPAA